MVGGQVVVQLAERGQLGIFPLSKAERRVFVRPHKVDQRRQGAHEHRNEFGVVRVAEVLVPENRLGNERVVQLAFADLFQDGREKRVQRPKRLEVLRRGLIEVAPFEETAREGPPYVAKELAPGSFPEQFRVFVEHPRNL